MPVPSGAALLDVWETIRGLPPPLRAQPLLATAAPGSSIADRNGMSIGARDRLLLSLRAALFGDLVEASMRCPTCGEDNAITFGVSDLPRARADAADHTSTVALDGWMVQFRVPAVADVQTGAVGSPTTVGAVRREVLAGCLLSVQYDGINSANGELPDHVVTAVIDAMAEADPGCDIELAITCAHCNTGWASPFDITTFLLAELDGWAYRLLDDVQVLAARYGWREPDVLALPARRRRFYVEAQGA